MTRGAKGVKQAIAKAKARCCLRSFIAFEHHGVRLRQHAHTTCSQPGCLSTGQSSGCKDPAAACPSPSHEGYSHEGYSRTCPSVLCCACVVLTASPVPCPHPCPLADWRDGLPLRCGKGSCGGDGAPPRPRRCPECLGTLTTQSFMALGKEGREGVRVQRCTRACHERCAVTHEPSAQALRSP